VINVNLYGTAIYNNTAWNNWQVTTSLTSPLLKYSDGVSSTATAVLSSQISYADNGANYPVTMCPQVAGRDASYATTTRTLTLNGLDNAKLYDIKLCASRGNAGQTTRFSINGINIDIATYLNYTNAANFVSISPVNGRIVVTLTQLALYNYLNAFTVTEKTVGATNMITRNSNETDEMALLADTVVSTPLRIVPNPVADEFTLQISNERMGVAVVRILDQQGIVKRQFTCTKNKVVAEVKINSGAMQAGIYFIEVIIGSWKNTGRMIKL
jgi:hypothetical protein